MLFGIRETFEDIICNVTGEYEKVTPKKVSMTDDQVEELGNILTKCMEESMSDFIKMFLKEHPIVKINK